PGRGPPAGAWSGPGGRRSRTGSGWRSAPARSRSLPTRVVRSSPPHRAHGARGGWWEPARPRGSGGHTSDEVGAGVGAVVVTTGGDVAGSHLRQVLNLDLEGIHTHLTFCSRFPLASRPPVRRQRGGSPVSWAANACASAARATARLTARGPWPTSCS